MMNWEYQPRTVDLLSFLYTLGYFSILGIAFFVPFPQENRDVLNVLLGILSMVMVKIVEAYFNKDAANSATSTAIRAMNATPSIIAPPDPVASDSPTAPVAQALNVPKTVPKPSTFGVAKP